MDRERALAYGYAPFFAVAAALSALMLVTDHNLRTDFGSLSGGYFSHWYGVLVATAAEALGAVGLLVVPRRSSVRAGAVGAGLLVLVFLGDLLTYREVGFSSAGAFANYLFGVRAGGGHLRYLYDAVLAVDLAAFVYGLAALVGRRRPAPPVAGGTPPARGS